MEWGWIILTVVAVGTFGVPAIAIWGNSARAGAGRRYRALAEKSEANRREVADTLVEMREWLTSVDGRLGSLDKRLAQVEKLLREVG